MGVGWRIVRPAGDISLVSVCEKGGLGGSLLLPSGQCLACGAGADVGGIGDGDDILVVTTDTIGFTLVYYCQHFSSRERRPSSVAAAPVPGVVVIDADLISVSVAAAPRRDAESSLI